MKKKMLAMLLALAMVLTSVPSTVYATGDSGTDDSAVTTEVDGQTDDADADNQSEEDVDQDADDADDTIVDTEEKENTPAATSEEGEEATEQGEDAWYNANATEFVIDSVEELHEFALITQGKHETIAIDNFNGKTIKLGADINLEDTYWYHRNAEGNVLADYRIVDFAGTFDGAGYTISNINLLNEYDSGSSVGLCFFRNVTGTIKNLTLNWIDADSIGNTSFYGLANQVQTSNGAKSENANVVDVHVKNVDVNIDNDECAEDTYSQVAGLIRWAGKGTVAKDCSVSKMKANVTGTVAAGGFSVFVAQTSEFYNCDVNNFTLNTGSVDYGVGGFGGQVQSSSYVQRVFNNCDVKNVNITVGYLDAMVGGFLGNLGGMVDCDGCDVTGKITITDDAENAHVGGFTGDLGWQGDWSSDKIGHTFDKCTANVDITAVNSDVGGFVGMSAIVDDTVLDQDEAFAAVFTDCKAYGDVTTVNGSAGGFVGSGDRGEYNDCLANGSVKGNIAGGFWGEVFSMPAAPVNGNTGEGDDFTGVVITDCTASNNVTGTTVAGLIGYLDKTDNTSSYETPVNLSGNTYNEELGEYNEEPTVFKVSNKTELKDALDKAEEGDVVEFIKDIDYGTDQLEITKAITLDLGGYTLTTRARNYGIACKNDGLVITNGKLNHAGTVAAIKVWNAKEISNLEIDVTGTSSSGNTINGIVIQEDSEGVDTIKNVKIHSTSGQGVACGIETYNCGNATEPVIGSMENVTIDAKVTGMNISAPCGTATNCEIKGGTSGIEIWIKGTYSASLDLVGCTVEGGEQAVYAHDEFNSNPIVNNGQIKLTADDTTIFTCENGTKLTKIINRVSEEQVILPESLTDGLVAKVGDTYYDSLSKAIAVANAIEGGATVTLLKDVTLGEKLTISGNVTISGEHTITRDDACTGTLFAVNAEAALTLDGGLVVDGANEYVFDKEAYEKDLADWENAVPTAESTKWFTPEEGAPVATAYMITTSGTVNLNDVAIKNHYSTNGSGIVSASKGANVTLDGAQITHNANTSGSGLVVNASTNVYSREEELITVTMNEGTVIDGNHVGGNHGIFKIYMGTYFTMNGGEIKNTTGWNSNGTVVGIYHGVFTMNGGTICSNSSVYGPNNGRNAAIYGHSNHLFTMNGGTICHNTGRSKAGIDSPYSETGYTGQTFINGGTVVDNTVLGSWTEPDVSGGATLTVSGGTYTQDVSKYLAPDTGLVYDEETRRYTVTDHVYNLWFRDPSTGEQVPGVGPLQGNNLAELIETGKLFYADYYDMELEVLSNVKVDETAVIDYPMTINLNGHTITGAAKEGVQVYPVIRVQGGADVIVKGEGGITNADYVFVVGASDGTSTGNLTIESGKYKGQTTVASVTKGTLTIKGGEFSINEEAETYDYAYVLNCVDANYKDDSAKIEVTGGTFHKFNPAENAAEGTGTNFVPEKYESTYDEEADTYTVAEMDYVKWVQEQLYAGNDVKLEKDIVITDYELVHAHAFPSNGNGKYNEVHGNGAIFHVIEPGVELDLNGHSITWDAHDDDYCNKRQVSLFMVTIEGNAGDESSLTIKDSGGTGRVDVYGMGTGMYVVGVDAKATIEGGTWTNYPCNTCQASNIFMYPSHGGEMYITDGTFEQKDSEYLLGWKGSSEKTTNNGVGVDYDETKVEITGGTFVGFNPEEVKFFDTANSGQETINGLAEGYAANESESDGTTEYKVVNAVVEMDGKYYETIKDALFTLKSADTTVHKVKVLQDHEIDVNYSTYNYPILVNGFAIELDLNGKTITADWSKYTGSRKDNALIGVCNGGKLTVIDSSEEKLGKIINNDSKEDVENRIFWIMTSTATKSIEVNIEGGNFYQNDVNTALLYVQGNKPSDNLAPIYVNIKGGYFETVDDDFFNAYDGYQHESYITGGTFNKNPEDHEIKIHPDYQAVENEDGTYSVVEKIVAKIGETGYTTLADALANAKSGETVYMVADHEDKSAATIIPAGVTLDLKGKVVEAKNVLAFGTVIDTADVVGGIKISNDTTEAIVHLQPENGGYLPIYDTTYTDNNATGCYRFFDYRLLSGKDTGVDENTGKSYAKLIVKFKFTNNQAYEVLARTSITGLDLLADIIWTNASTTIAYKFKPETIKEYAQTECDVLTGKRTDIKNPVLTLKLFGIEKLNSGDIISMTPSVSTYSSVVVTGRKNDVTIE